MASRGADCRIAEYDPSMLGDITRLYNRAIRDVPFCFPASESAMADALAGGLGNRAEDCTFDEQRPIVALDDDDWAFVRWLGVDEPYQGVARKSLEPILRKMISDKLVVSGRLTPGARSVQYCWAARWGDAAEQGIRDQRDELVRLGERLEKKHGRSFGIDDEPVTAFREFLLTRYAPPANARFLVFFQCSVRRPFTKSPSHGSMKRAVRVATGYDPAKQWQQCPVHVVVMASRMGPVPYELEDTYPANVGGGGVKHFSDEEYSRVKPILARRVADYIRKHRKHYEHITTFTESRYGEVMAEARDRAGIEFPILPVEGGPIISMMGASRPRTYWAKCWIQLYLEIVSWLDGDELAAARERLAKLEVVHDGRPAAGRQAIGKKRRRPK